MFDKLEDLVKRLDEVMQELSEPDVVSDQNRFRNLMKEQNELAPIVEKYKEYKEAKQTIEDSVEMLEEEHDEEMRELLKEELSEAKKNVEQYEEELKVLLLPKDPNDDKNVIVEIRAGAGGDEAALFAARSNKRTVSMLEFEKAKDKINMGPERRTMIMTDKQKESTAYHEAGHAIVGYLVPEHDPVHKVTIIPRGRALGVTFFLPEGDQISISQKQLESKLSTLYAGRLAEDLIYGEENISTGASNDIKVATNIARNMVTQWGFSDKLGPILYAEDEGEVFLGRSMAKAKHMSDETAHVIDEEVRAIVNRNYARARQILIDNMDILHAMKDALVKYETIEEEQIKQLMNREPVTAPSGWEDNKDTKPTAKPQEEKTESAVNHSEDPEA